MTIFNNDPSTPHTPDSYLDELVGEGKKFSDAEALARGKWESDRFIEQLQAETATLRADLASRANLETLVSKIGETGKGASTPAENHSAEERLPITPEAIKDIIKNVITEDKVLSTRDANLSYCEGELRKSYGDGYVSKLREVTKSLGLTEKYVDDLAATAPKALLALVNANAPQKVDVSAPKGSVFSGNFNGKTATKDWAYYQNLRKTNPRLYYSVEVQSEMHTKAMKGELEFPKS